MFRRTFRMATKRPALGAAALLMMAAQQPSRAIAQEEPPSRIGNRWDSLSHQPTEGDVNAAEQEWGVAPSPEHEQVLDDELEKLDRQLLSAEQHHPPRKHH